MNATWLMSSWTTKIEKYTPIHAVHKANRNSMDKGLNLSKIRSACMTDQTTIHCSWLQTDSNLHPRLSTSTYNKMVCLQTKTILRFSTRTKEIWDRARLSSCRTRCSTKSEPSQPFAYKTIVIWPIKMPMLTSVIKVRDILRREKRQSELPPRHKT